MDPCPLPPLLWCLLLLPVPLSGAAAQAPTETRPTETRPTETRPTQTRLPALSKSQQEAARAALERVAARHRDAEVLTADYRQERSSALLVRPLISKGRLALRRDPPCLMFHTAGEGGTVIRLTRTMYEVHRPTHKTLERTPMAAPTLPDALFQAFRPDPEELARRFRITALEPGDGELSVHLSPLEAATAKFVRELVVTLASETGQLRAVAYRDAQGDRVRLVLVDLQLDPKGKAPRFELDVPAGTRILSHEAVGGEKDGEGGEKRRRR